MIQANNIEDRTLIEKVYQGGQEHVFRWWDELSDASRERLLSQLQHVDFELLHELRDEYLQSMDRTHTRVGLEPVEVIPLPRTEAEQKAAENARVIGEDCIRSGRVAAFLVAGGQGTRLGFDGPKGAFPMGPVSRISLFRMHAEKILAANRAYGVTIPWYIMTSESNDESTRHFFQQHHFFGFHQKDVIFFPQRMIPAMDDKGKLILDSKDHIFMNPNGHGGSLLALEESGALNDMKSRGVEILSYFQVDNVLIRIVDPLFIGYHVQAHAEMSSKMVTKRDPWEKVGVFGRLGGKLKVIEYSDMREEDMVAKDPNGNLKYGAGSIAIHIINVDFIKEEVSEGIKLPYHVAHKKIPFIGEKGTLISPETPNGYKFELFVFDALGDTENSVIMEVAREEEFSPVKNKSGRDSEGTARRDLCNYFGRWLEAAAVAVPKNKNDDVDGLIEISPLYAINMDEFLGKIPRDIHFDGSLYLGPK